MLRGVRATAAEQLAASLQSLDPQQQKEQARATCELLEQAVSSFSERLVSLVGTAQSHQSDADPLAAPQRRASGQGSPNPAPPRAPARPPAPRPAPEASETTA